MPPGKPVTYLGQRYRSRSEAKWAMVFTLLRIPFMYEPEQIRLPSGAYLPDFWLPMQAAYFEVKAHDVDDPRHVELGALDGVRVFLGASNLPQIPPQWLSLGELHDALRGTIWQKYPFDPRQYMWAREANGHYNLVPLAVSPFVNGGHWEILEAYITACSYSFREVI